MITRFGSLFAGHVDLGDLGFDATSANDRWLSDEHLATVFDKTQAIAELMDRTGYHTREVESFGAPMLDQDANRELFEEQIEIIFKAFDEPAFSHRGKHYTIPPRVPYRGYELEEITLVPRPPHRPVECWQPVVSASQRGLDFMAKYGIKGIIGGGAAAGGAAQKTVVAWRETLARRGRETELGADLLIGYSFYIA